MKTVILVLVSMMFTACGSDDSKELQKMLGLTKGDSGSDTEAKKDETTEPEAKTIGQAKTESAKPSHSVASKASKVESVQSEVSAAKEEVPYNPISLNCTIDSLKTFDSYGVMIRMDASLPFTMGMTFADKDGADSKVRMFLTTREPTDIKQVIVYSDSSTSDCDY